MENEQQFLFDERFLQKYAGNSILNDPVTAIIELIANSWDAGAKNVWITWPDQEKGKKFKIKDDGCGMTANEFEKIWSTLYYNRVKEKGKLADKIPEQSETNRIAFGKNGVGRFASFCFGEEYILSTKKDGKENTYLVKQSNDIPFEFEKKTEKPTNEHGTVITTVNPKYPDISLENIKAEIAMRFLADPNFKIFVSGEEVLFEDISEKNIKEETIEISDIGKANVKIIDMKESDKSSKHHGVAWRVHDRLVGDISWDHMSSSYHVDKRRTPLKQYSFIVSADCLNKYVLQDWTGFKYDEEEVKKVQNEVYDFIWKELVSYSKEQREDTFNRIEESLKPTVNKMTPLRKEKWTSFVKSVQEKCPSLNEKDLTIIAELLADLEVSSNKYQLLYRLNNLSVDNLDDLNDILKNWSVDYAKIILDELETRIDLLKQLEKVLYSGKADELHELQPLFHRGLWIFGPEYETIEFTSNKGMTKVIQNLFGKELKGSRNRPDFAILKDATVGLYSYPTFDDQGAEIGVDKLTIVELKAPGVKITGQEINQAWKYVKELIKRGVLIENKSRVTCFVVGQEIEEAESGGMSRNNGTVNIKPMLYDTVIRRAKSRLFKLYDRVKDAPFSKEIDDDFFENSQIDNQRELRL